MDSIRKCINAAGSLSRIRLSETPTLEVETFLGETARKALSCWDYRIGEIITVTGPSEKNYRARITSIADNSFSVIPFQKASRTESHLTITLFQALPEKERFELILQKATELGVNRIVPYVSERSISLSERDAGQKKSHRWANVILRAAKQCRRAEIPELSPVVEWETALRECSTIESSFVCYEGHRLQSLASALKNADTKHIALMVGPEGGFKLSEIEIAKSLNVLPVSLGPRILRTETAAIVGAGIIQFALGDIGCQE